MKRCAKMIAAFMTMLAFTIFSASEARVSAAEATNWDDGTITVVGMGIAPARTTNQAQARYLARRAAIVDGYRQMAESVNGVNVDSETTVENMMVLSDVTKTKVSAVIRGAKVISERSTPDGGYEVTMQIPLFGLSDSLASAVLPAPATKEAFPAPATGITPSIPSNAPSYAASAPSGKAIGGYTGVIIDCRGLGLQPAMSAVIKNEKGQPIYGYKNLDYDMVISKGMLSYATDPGNAPRAGSNPLYLKAIRLDNHNGNAVLSMEDANRLLIENGATGFLDRTAVVFLR